MPPLTMNPAQFHKDMRVGEIIAILPGAADIMTEYGMHCSSCSLGAVETLGEGARIHQFEDDVLEELLDDLNAALKDEPTKEHKLIITPAAARQVRQIADAEGVSKAVLHVVIDISGGFCLEFAEEEIPDGKSFGCAEVPGVSVSASTLVLGRIGGAVIDFREERFKLDLPEEAAEGCCQGDKNTCGCS